MAHAAAAHHSGSPADTADAPAHAHGHGHHGHVIVPLWLLRSVLAALLFFTLLTVGTAQAEVWIGDVFHVALPHWLNVAVALSIALVKTVLVVTFFMQLRYDNPLNTMVLIFTILTVGFFLGFTSLDLGNRGTLDRQKAKYVIDGGTGMTGVKAKGSVMDGLANTPATEAAVKAAQNKGKYKAHYAGGHGHGHGGGDRGPRQSITHAGFAPVRRDAGSTANISRPVSGLTLPGFAAANEHGEHAVGAGTGDHGAAGAHAKDADHADKKNGGEAKPSETATPGQPH